VQAVVVVHAVVGGGGVLVDAEQVAVRAAEGLVYVPEVLQHVSALGEAHVSYRQAVLLQVPDHWRLTRPVVVVAVHALTVLAELLGGRVHLRLGYFVFVEFEGLRCFNDLASMAHDDLRVLFVSALFAVLFGTFLTEQ